MFYKFQTFSEKKVEKLLDIFDQENIKYSHLNLEKNNVDNFLLSNVEVKFNSPANLNKLLLTIYRYNKIRNLGFVEILQTLKEEKHYTQNKNYTICFKLEKLLYDELKNSMISMLKHKKYLTKYNTINFDYEKRSIYGKQFLSNLKNDVNNIFNKYISFDETIELVFRNFTIFRSIDYELFFANICKGTTRKGVRCKNRTHNKIFCHLH